jgi:hypothetical protein
VDETNPAPYCDPCRAGMHALCDGWLDGFCACTTGACLADLTESPEER